MVQSGTLNELLFGDSYSAEEVSQYTITDILKRRKLEDIPPIYITHGTVDTAVPFAQAVEVVEALQKKGANVAFDIVPDKDHGWDEKEEGETMDRLYAFVGEHL